MSNEELNKDFGQQFKLSQELNLSKKKIIKQVQGLIINAISKNLPKEDNGKIGVLFSGGVDSTSICFILKELGVDFICYTAALEEPGMEKAPDLVWAQKAAKKYNFPLKIRKINLKQTEKYVKKTASIIKSSNVVKIGVALPFLLALEQAQKDGTKYVFSGLGTEEIFAGYERHKKAAEKKEINKECLAGIRMIYQRDLERDLRVAEYCGLKLLLPFLDKKLVDFALKIPGKYKIGKIRKSGEGKEKEKTLGKLIFRQAMQDLGLDKEVAMRPKKAVQYGSKIDRALGKLAKKQGKSKSGYLQQFYQGPVRLAALVSGGKDSWLAAHLRAGKGDEIACLITIESENPDSYMYHTPSIDLVKEQARAAGLPLITEKTKGEKEKELNDLKRALERAKKEYAIEGITTGALFSNYQKERIEKIAKSLGLKVFSPLWQMDQEKELKLLLKEKFDFIIIKIAAYGLDKKWLGRKLDQKSVNELIALARKIQFNPAGEGGEYETLVLNCPLFKKRMIIEKTEIKEESEECAELVIKEVRVG